MTDQRELDRLLGAYFIDGTDELADRVIDAALDQIDHTQQQYVPRMPRRMTTMTTPLRLATTAVIGLIAVGGGLYLLQPGRSTVGSPSPTPAQTTAMSSVAQTPAMSSVAGGRTGAAHYEITGPDATSGTVKFASSVTSGASSEAWGQSVLFQEGSLVIRIKFPAPANCLPGGDGGCGTVSFSTTTLNLQDVGWRALPLPGGPSCTWDTATVTANGGTGSVECTNAVNPTDPATPDSITIAFTYHDPSPGQVAP